MPSIRRSPFFRGSAFVRLTEGMFGGCHRFKSIGLEKAEIDPERVKLDDDLPRGVTSAVQDTNPARSAGIGPIVAHVQLDEELSRGTIDAMSLFSPSDGLDLDFDLEYPLTDPDTSPTPSDQLELEFGFGTEIEQALATAHRYSTSVDWYPTSLPMLDLYPRPGIPLSQKDYPLSGPLSNLESADVTVTLLSDSPSDSTHSQIDDCRTLGLPLPYPVFTAPASSSKPTSMISSQLTPLLSLHSDNDLPLGSCTPSTEIRRD